MMRRTNLSAEAPPPSTFCRRVEGREKVQYKSWERDGCSKGKGGKREEVRQAQGPPGQPFLLPSSFSPCLCFVLCCSCD